MAPGRHHVPRPRLAGDEPFVVAGGPRAVMTALGITAEVLDDLEGLA
ncbi:hypothetical protein ACFWJW_21390 [Streptomyces sp. NPDC127097]